MLLTTEQQSLLTQAQQLMGGIYSEQPKLQESGKWKEFLVGLLDAGLWSAQMRPFFPHIHPRNPEEAAFIIPPKADGHEGWIFKGEVNLISGSSGSGKSTLVLNMLEQARQGESVLGHPALARDYRVIMFDRSEAAFNRTAERLNLGSEARARIYRPNQKLRWPLTRILNEYMNQVELDTADPDTPSYPDVLFCEGLDMLVPNGEYNDFDVVSRFLEELVEVARFWDVAILGSVGSPKQKSKDRYLLARDNIFGSVAWGRKSETILHVQLSDPENSNSARQLVALPRNGPAETYRLRFRYGRLEEAPELDGVEETRAALAGDSDYDCFVAAVRGLAPGTPINTRFVPGVSQSTISRYLRRMQGSGTVGKPDGAWVRLDENVESQPRRE
jgi:energy-coupling factor transporter ATP-binding protein EcfA2